MPANKGGQANMPLKNDKLKYKRVLIKISGEALAGKAGFGIDQDVLNEVSTVVSQVYEMGVEIALVIGGGNIWRGRSGKGMDRTRADHMGMLATVINALALLDALEAKGVHTRVQTAIEMRQIAEPYIRGRAVRHLEKGRVVIFACGTGNPFFSTDTAAALRAVEIDAEVILKATNVDGVYNKDPKKEKDAVRFKELSYIDVLNQRLGVMDSTAISLSMDNKLPIIVFKLSDSDNLLRILEGDDIGTVVRSTAP